MSPSSPTFSQLQTLLHSKSFCRIPNHQANTFSWYNELNSSLCEVTELQNTVEQKNNKMTVGRNWYLLNCLGSRQKKRIFYCQADCKGGEGSGPSGSTPSTPFLRAWKDYFDEPYTLSQLPWTPTKWKITVLTIFESLRRLELIMLESRQ